METTLHRQLKGLYGVDDASREVRVDGYRIDAIREGSLVEVQVASLAAIRSKVADLLERHCVVVVKPVAVRSYIVRRKSALGLILGSRYSPTTHDACEFFEDFVHFTKVFPHPNLTVELLLIEQEEVRIPRRSWRRGRNYRVADRLLRRVVDRRVFRTASDLCHFLPENLPPRFTTADLARHAGIPRWLAQKAAYSLRCTGAIAIAGKTRNSVVYEVLRLRKRAA